jgi:hypothetical protein
MEAHGEGDPMSLFKAALGLSGVDQVAGHIVRMAEARRAKGENADFWAEYSQQDIGIRLNASLAIGLVQRKLEQAGLSVVDHKATGRYGDPVRLLVGTQRR